MAGGVSAPAAYLSVSLVEFGDGSASAPSVSNTGDPNTGVYFPNADQVAVACGGSQVALFTAFGNSCRGALSATIGPEFGIINSNSTGADGDTTGYLTFYGPDTGGGTDAYCYLECIAVDASAGTEDSRLNFHLLAAGADITPLRIEGYQLLARGTGNPIAYSFQEDTNTGLQWVSADHFGAICGGTNYAWHYNGSSAALVLNSNTGGTIGVFGATGSTRMAFSADATDAATTQALVNAIKAKLVAWGFMAAS